MDTVLITLLLLGSFAINFLVIFWAPSYFKEKGKNLATREDISGITKKIEEVKKEYTVTLKQLEHQHNVLLEALKSRNQLRVAAAEKRLEVHQQAFVKWRDLISRVHNENEDLYSKVLECQIWWEQNCLYLSSESRTAFNDAYAAAQMHRALLKMGERDAKALGENWDKIIRAGDVILAAVELPSLGEREFERVENKKAFVSSPAPNS